MAQEKVTLAEILTMAGFSGIAGGLSYTMRTLNKDEKPKALNLIIEIFGSGFVGILAMLMCREFELSIYWTGLIVGVFGWIGADASIVLLTKLIKKRLGVDNGDNKGA